MSIRDLAQDGRFIVKQRVEGLEALTGIETRNRYEVLTPGGQAVMWAYEESGGLSRLFLKRHRPLTLHITDLNGQDILVASRGFFWLFAHMRVQDGDERPVGAIRRKFGLLKRRLVIEDAGGDIVAEVSGSVFRRYTFTIKRLDQEVGRVTKQWSGLGREMFTDADTFLVELPIKHGDDDFQSLVLATAFAVDLDFFENS
jgi:uncharacterized protein YxjI